MPSLNGKLVEVVLEGKTIIILSFNYSLITNIKLDIIKILILDIMKLSTPTTKNDSI